THTAREYGIKPIVGMEAYLAITDRHDPRDARLSRHTRTVADPDGTISDDSEDSARRRFPATDTKTLRYEHLTVLARNATGWANLVALHNASQHPDAFWYKPRIDWDVLA